jgi:hypothetical protein
MPSTDTDALIAGLGMDRASQLAVLKEMQERLAGRTDQLRVLLRLVPWMMRTCGARWWPPTSPLVTASTAPWPGAVAARLCGPGRCGRRRPSSSRCQG